MNAHETNQLARRLVEDAIRQRGGCIAETLGTNKKYMCVHDMRGQRTITIFVRSKRSGNWHATINDGRPAPTIPEQDDIFWVFVHLTQEPQFWIVPDWWIRDCIYRKHKEYLEINGGHRPVNDDSDHHSVKTESINEWKNRWELLQVF